MFPLGCLRRCERGSKGVRNARDGGRRSRGASKVHDGSGETKAILVQYTRNRKPYTGPHTPFTEVSASEVHSFGTAVLTFQEVEAVEAAGNRGVPGDRGDSGYDGGSEAGWGGIGDASYFGAPQLVRVSEL